MATVLIVDDDAVTRRMLTRGLESVGYHVRAAPTAERGLEFAAVCQPDVILLDVRLPGCNGFDLISVFGRVAPGAPVIIITGQPEKEHVVEVLRTGAFDYLSKAEFPELLLERVARAAQHRLLSLTNHELEAQNVANQRVMSELETSRNQLQDFLDGAADPIQSVDQSGRFHYVNRAWLQTLEYTREDVGHLRIWDVLDPDSHPVYRTTLERLAGGSAKEIVELILHSKSGARIEVAGSAAASFAGNDFSFTRWIFHDVTTRNRALRELDHIRREAERSAREISVELEEVFRTTTGGFRIIDRDFTVLRANDTLARLANVPVADMVGRKCFETFPGEACGTDDCTLVRALRGQPMRTEEVNKRTIHGREVPCRLNARPLRVASGEIATIVEEFHDLTETRRLQSIAESVSATENVGYVVSGIRHELGNPVNSLKTTIAVLRKKTARAGTLEPAVLEEYLDRCDREVARMEYILRSLRSLNMFERLETQAIPLRQFLADFRRLVTRDLGEVQLAIDFAADHVRPVVSADPNALHQVLLNLVANAADALDARPDPLISIRTEELGELTMLVVEDNGRGMSERELADLFKPLHTNKPKGTGLGMTIVRKALARMGGTIDVSSTLGTGTRVAMLLRAVASDSSQEAPCTRC